MLNYSVLFNKSVNAIPALMMEVTAMARLEDDNQRPRDPSQVLNYSVLFNKSVNAILALMMEVTAMARLEDDNQSMGVI